MISYHHIGGRNGTFPLPLRDSPLTRDFNLVVYDADENCQASMTPDNQELWGNVTILPYCISGKNQIDNFNINHHPTTSSLYNFNPKYSKYAYIENPMYGNYILGDACKHIKKTTVQSYTLASILEKLNLEPIDFLSLDVQGAEYDILDSSRKLISMSCVGIQLEVAFGEIYKDQKLFADIHTLLETLGFELLDLDLFGRYSPIPIPVGFRGSEQPLYAEATYIRKIECFNKKNSLDLMLKAAFFALLHHKMGMCLHYLTKAADLGWPDTHTSSNDSHYIQLLLKIYALYKASEHLIFPSISSLVPHDAFQSYYSSNTTSKDVEHLSRNHKNLLILQENVEHVSDKNTHTLEQILDEYNLLDIKNCIRKNRQNELSILNKLKKRIERELADTVI